MTKSHENSFNNSVRCGRRDGWYICLFIPRPLRRWLVSNMAISRHPSPTDRGRPVDFVLGFSAWHRATSVFRTGLVHGGRTRANLLKSFVLLGNSVPRWFQPDHLAVAFRVSCASRTYTGDFAFGLSLHQAHGGWRSLKTVKHDWETGDGNRKTRNRNV